MLLSRDTSHKDAKILSWLEVTPLEVVEKQFRVPDQPLPLNTHFSLAHLTKKLTNGCKVR